MGSLHRDLARFFIWTLIFFLLDTYWFPKQKMSLSKGAVSKRYQPRHLFYTPLRTPALYLLQIKSLKNRMSVCVKPSPPPTFISLVHKVKQPFCLWFELWVSVLVRMVKHTQPPVGSLQLFRRGLRREIPLEDNQWHLNTIIIRISLETGTVSHIPLCPLHRT